MTAMPTPPAKAPRRTRLRSIVRWLVLGLVFIWVLAALTLVAARWIDPPTTAVHMQRHFQRSEERRVGKECS